MDSFDDTCKSRLVHIQYLEQYFALYDTPDEQIYIHIYPLQNTVIGHTESIHVPDLLKFWLCYREVYMLALSDFVYILFVYLNLVANELQ